MTATERLTVRIDAQHRTLLDAAIEVEALPNESEAIRHAIVAQYGHLPALDDSADDAQGASE